MKVYFTFFLAIIAVALIISCSNQKDDETADKAETEQSDTISIHKSVYYVTYSGTVTDDGEISGGKNNEEYHIFTLNSDEENFAFLISSENYRKWTSQNIIPNNLTIGETYAAEIEEGKEIPTDDKNVTYILISKLSSLKLSNQSSNPDVQQNQPK